MRIVSIASVAAMLAALAVTASAAPKSPTEKDWKPQLRESLTPQPWVGAMPAFKDRAAWAKLAALPNMKKTLEQAAKRLTEKFAVPPDELYLEFYRNGNRTNYQKAYGKIDGASSDFALAYLMTGDQRYLEKLDEVLGVLFKMKSWMLPAHDSNHRTFDGKGNHIELCSSLLSWRLGLIYRLLKDELKPGVAAELKKQLYDRTITPATEMLAGKRRKDWWMTGTNNWNAVCWMGVTGCELAVEEDPDKRVEFVDGALRHIGYSMLGFEKDGYCSEGMGYWNYGYGHNLRFAAAIRLATGGKINLMEMPEMRIPGEYAEKITIVDRIVPAYADCALNSSASPFFLGLRDYLMDRPSEYWANLRPGGQIDDAMLGMTIPAPQGKVEKQAAAADTSVFEEAGIVVLRPATDAAKMAVSFKGGSNFELHNHNDVGSYVVVLDGATVVFDPGSEVYSRRTFSKDRYVSRLLNSYGHPVPMIDGKLQKDGKGTKAKLLKQVNNATEFLWTIDMTPAYQLPEVKTLERTFRYLRTAPGAFSVRDYGVFSHPVAFETAILTPGVFKVTSATGGEFTYKKKTLKVEIKSSTPFEFLPEEIKENVAHKETITRIGLRFREKVTTADITVTFTPAK